MSETFERGDTANLGRLRVTMISYVRPDVPDGRRTHVLELAQELGKLTELELLVPALEGCPPLPEGQPPPSDGGAPESASCRLNAIPYRHQLPIPSLWYDWALGWYLRQGKGDGRRPQVLYVRQTLVSRAPFAVARRWRIPLVLEANGLVEDEFVLARGMGWLAPALRAYVRWQYRRAAAVVAVTRRLADAIMGRYGIPSERLHVVSNGANTELFRPADPDRARRLAADLVGGKASGFLSGRAFLLGFVGNLAPWQGLDTLIDAFATFVTRVPEARLLIVGDGPMASHLDRRLRERDLGRSVLRVGAVPYHQVPVLVAACDLLVAPLAATERNQLTGVSPLKVYEYLACGRPVVTSDLPGLEFVERAAVGWQFPAGDAGALAATLMKVFEAGPRLRREMGARGRKYVESAGSWAHAARTTEALLRATVVGFRAHAH